MTAKLTWETVSWRLGEDRFTFEIERGGLFATVKAPGSRSMTLPMVVWEGLLDAMTANRATRKKVEQQFPVRTGARWYDGEAAELADGYRSGRTIAQLAKSHNRSEYAIEHQLDKMGLISNAQKYGQDRRAQPQEPVPVGQERAMSNAVAAMGEDLPSTFHSTGCDVRQ